MPTNALRPLLLLLLLLRLANHALTSATPLPLLNQAAFVTVQLALTPPGAEGELDQVPRHLDLRFTCASREGTLSLNTTVVTAGSGEPVPVWLFAIDRLQLQRLEPCWVTAHRTRGGLLLGTGSSQSLARRQQVGFEVVPALSASKGGAILPVTLHLQLDDAPFATDSLGWFMRRLHEVWWRTEEGLVARGWLHRDGSIAEDMAVLAVAMLLVLAFAFVLGSVVLRIVVGKEAQQPRREETPRTAAAAASTALVVRHPDRLSSSGGGPRRNPMPPPPTRTRRGTSSHSSKEPTPHTFSSHWQCVVHNRHATPTLLNAQDLDGLARGAFPKDVVATLLRNNPNVRGVVLSATR